MKQTFYMSAFTSSSIMMPFVWLLAATDDKWWSALPLTTWWVFSLTGLIFKWGK